MNIKGIEFPVNEIDIKVCKMVFHFQFSQWLPFPIKQKYRRKPSSYSLIILEAFIDIDYVKKIISIGRSKEYMPEMISSNSKYFYCYVQPASLLKHIEEGNSFENHPILKSIDFEKIDREDNPI